MHTSDFNDVQQYLDTIIADGKRLFNLETLSFYEKNKIPYSPILFDGFYDEYFYLVFSYKEFGIYFNDIEETFGICKLDGNSCQKYIEFFDDLAPTVQKFQNLLLNNKLSQVFTRSTSPEVECINKLR